MNFTHRKLCEDLAQTKGTRFFEVPCGCAANNVPIADVIVVSDRQFKNFVLDIYECKVSRSDFLADLHSDKYKSYLEYCNRFYYATLPGIAKPEEIPAEIGLIVRDELKGWLILKNAKKRYLDIPRETLLALIFKKLSQDNFERRNHIYLYSEEKYWTTGRGHLKKILNPKVRKALAFYDKYKNRIEDEENKFKSR
jgi:hypothetical protein